MGNGGALPPVCSRHCGVSRIVVQAGKWVSPVGWKKDWQSKRQFDRRSIHGRGPFAGTAHPWFKDTQRWEAAVAMRTPPHAVSTA